MAAGTLYCVCTVIWAGREQKITAVTLLLASFLRLTAESSKAKPRGELEDRKTVGNKRKWKTGHWELEEIRALMKPWYSKFQMAFIYHCIHLIQGYCDISMIIMSKSC